MSAALPMEARCDLCPASIFVPTSHGGRCVVCGLWECSDCAEEMGGRHTPAGFLCGSDAQAFVAAAEPAPAPKQTVKRRRTA